jgi:hypothetical protein
LPSSSNTLFCRRSSGVNGQLQMKYLINSLFTAQEIRFSTIDS